MEVVDKDVFYHCQFSRMYILELWKSAPGLPIEKTRQVLQLLLEKIPTENVQNENLCHRVEYLCKKLTGYWKTVNRTYTSMVRRYCDWLKWQVRSKDEQELVAQKKKSIQREFKTKLGLIVDKPRSGGSGTSNDGNTARKFFANSAIAAEITGIKKDLIDRCTTILDCLNSGYKINSNKFKLYAIDTARQLVHEYPWYNLPASVHKVLIHGDEVINHVLVPIGELSEEAAESTNKNIKAFRLNNTRKMTRVLTNTDLLNRLLLNSDPYITGLRKLPKKKKTVLSESVINLLDFKI